MLLSSHAVSKPPLQVETVTDYTLLQAKNSREELLEQNKQLLLRLSTVEKWVCDSLNKLQASEQGLAKREQKLAALQQKKI